MGGLLWRFAILGVPLSKNPFHKATLGIQTTNPNHQLTISWFLYVAGLTSNLGPLAGGVVNTEGLFAPLRISKWIFSGGFCERTCIILDLFKVICFTFYHIESPSKTYHWENICGTFSEHHGQANAHDGIGFVPRTGDVNPVNH